MNRPTLSLVAVALLVWPALVFWSPRPGRALAIPAVRLDQALAGVAGYRAGLLIRPGPHRVAIGVRDEIGNVVATLVVEHEVPAPEGTA